MRFRKPLLSRILLWQNRRMAPWPRVFLLFLIGLLVGVGYSRYVSPVKFVDVTPASLRIDYRSDFVLMVAENYHIDRNATLARDMLATMESGSAAKACSEALAFARASGYSDSDVKLIESLRQAMELAESWDGAPGIAP